MAVNAPTVRFWGWGVKSLLLLLGLVLPAHHARVHYLGLTRITCYLPTGNRTFTGTWPHWGTIAVDPSVIPLGADLLVSGISTTFRAEDTGGMVRGKHVDIFVYTLAQAYRIQGSGYAQVVWWMP